MTMASEPKSVEPIVLAEGVTRIFADFWGRPKVTAVADLSLAIRPGEVFGLLGPNGAGKSTTVKLLLGLLRPTRGKLSILGRPPHDLRSKERIGYLPEETRLYPYLTAEETLAFFGKLFDLTPGARRERCGQLLEMVGLGRARARRVGEYSKGMQRRLGLAQALLNDPDLLILDEPTSGLDPLGIREVKDLLLTLAERGKTILLCSHLLAEVEDVCDRVQILYAGRTLAEGGLKELLAQPDSLRLTVPALPSAALERVLAAVRREAADGRVEVDVPNRSLESFFLEVIERARAGDSGEAGGEVGPFLAAPSGLEALLPPGAEPAPAVAPEPVESADLAAADHSLTERFGLADGDDA